MKALQSGIMVVRLLNPKSLDVATCPLKLTQFCSDHCTLYMCVQQRHYQMTRLTRSVYDIYVAPR